MPNNDYANEPNQSRSEDIIQSILDNTEYDEAARSRIEYLLIELKNAIEGGGGGGGVTSYSPLTEKPKIDNHTLQAGNNSSSDLGLQTKLTFDSAPTENSTNPVTSAGVYTALGTKANSADVYNKSAVDTALSAKADKSTTYTKTEVDTSLSTKQNTISDLSTIRSGAALGVTAVQPVSGKGLSTNDYTTDEKNKLAGIEAQANKTTVDSALSESSTNPVQNKVVKSALDGKQATLTTAQLAAVNSGITSEKLTQDENNILWNTKQGVKNLSNTQLIYANPTAITFTLNTDKSVTLNGTSTSSSGTIPYIFDYDCKLTPNTNYICSGTNNNQVKVQVLGYNSDSDLSLLANSSDDVTFNSGSWSKYHIRCWIAAKPASGNQFNNVTIYPMVRPASISDPTYQPYALSNVELTSENETNKNNILLNEQMNGKKNYCQTNNVTFTGYNKVIYTDAISGDAVLYIDNITSTDTDATTNLIIFYSENGTQLAQRLCNRGQKVVYDNVALGNNVLHHITLYSSDNYAHSSGDTVTYTNIMICSKAAYTAFPTYQPYAISNVELTAKEQVNENNISFLTANGGGKNLLDCSLATLKADSYNTGGSYSFSWSGNVCSSSRGVSFTINADNTITITATSVTADVWFRIAQSFVYEVGSYTLSGCPANGSTSTYYIESDNLNIRDTGNGATITRSSSYTDSIFIVVKSGTTFTGTFKPMISLSSDKTYQPYAMSNVELTNNILLVSGYAIPEMPSGNLTDSNVQRDYTCRIVGYGADNNLCNHDGWCYIDTLVLNAENTRRMQKCNYADGVTKTRFYGGSPATWGSWV